MQGFFKHHLLGIKAWLSTVCCHTQAALLPSWGGSHRKGRGVNLPSSSKEGCARWVGCRRSQERPHMAETGAFPGASWKAAAPSCVGSLLPRVLQCPVLTNPGALALPMLSPAAAHLCSTSVSFLVHQPMHLQEPIQVLITGDKVLTANNQHKAPVTHALMPACPTLHPVAGLHS